MPGTILDDYLPKYDVVERHQLTIEAPREVVWEALQRTDFARSRIVRWLLRLRGLGSSASRSGAMNLAAFESARFAILEEVWPTHIVLGLVGRFWTPGGQLLRIDRQGFLSEPPRGFARAAWSFEFEPGESDGTLLATETRVEASDERSRRSFRRYWRLVGPFSGLIRREMLQEVRLEAVAAMKDS